MMTQTQLAIASVGNIAGQLQVPVSRILAVAASHGIRPTMSINGIVHFSEQDVERIAALVTQPRPTLGENV